MRAVWAALTVLACAALGLAGSPSAPVRAGGKKVDTRVFELRTYYAPAGKMEALHARFRDHTCKRISPFPP
jgi:hypothetical protein